MKHRVRRPLDLTLTGATRGLNSNSKVPGFLSIDIHRTHVVSPRGGIVTTCRLLLAPKFERTDVSSDDSVACQSILASDSLNDEQRGDDLCSPWLH